MQGFFHVYAESCAKPLEEVFYPFKGSFLKHLQKDCPTSGINYSMLLQIAFHKPLKESSLKKTYELFGEYFLKFIEDLLDEAFPIFRNQFHSLLQIVFPNF